MSHKVNKDENSKDPKWQSPMEMEGVKPGDYNISMNNTGGGTQQDDFHAPEGAPHGSGPADPAGNNVQEISPAARRLAHQTGRSG